MCTTLKHVFFLPFLNPQLATRDRPPPPTPSQDHPPLTEIAHCSAPNCAARGVSCRPLAHVERYVKGKTGGQRIKKDGFKPCAIRFNVSKPKG
uniref:Uncharacterized protein n=1 Tax=Hyaloperonospora arabidopsidis (strain Emoy2) TaxID=559515 RepID=M4B7R6_HYAAE